jgi:hypothetical protein
MSVRWKLQVTQDSSTYSVEDIRRIIGPRMTICGGLVNQPVFQFNFDDEMEAWEAAEAIAAQTSGVRTDIEAFGA